MDPETVFQRVTDAGITDARIVAITGDAPAGAVRIDATGSAVAPGFIDTHVRVVDPVARAMQLRDGVTDCLALHGWAQSVGEGA